MALTAALLTDVRHCYGAGNITDTSLPSELTLSQLLRLLYEQYITPCGDTCLTLVLKNSAPIAGEARNLGQWVLLSY